MLAFVVKPKERALFPTRFTRGNKAGRSESADSRRLKLPTTGIPRSSIIINDDGDARQGDDVANKYDDHTKTAQCGSISYPSCHDGGSSRATHCSEKKNSPPIPHVCSSAKALRGEPDDPNAPQAHRAEHLPAAVRGTNRTSNKKGRRAKKRQTFLPPK